MEAIQLAQFGFGPIKIPDIVKPVDDVVDKVKSEAEKITGDIKPLIDQIMKGGDLSDLSSDVMQSD